MNKIRKMFTSNGKSLAPVLKDLGRRGRLTDVVNVIEKGLYSEINEEKGVNLMGEDEPPIKFPFLYKFFPFNETSVELLE